MQIKQKIRELDSNICNQIEIHCNRLHSIIFSMKDKNIHLTSIKEFKLTLILYMMYLLVFNLNNSFLFILNKSITKIYLKEHL